MRPDSPRSSPSVEAFVTRFRISENRCTALLAERSELIARISTLTAAQADLKHVVETQHDEIVRLRKQCGEARASRLLWMRVAMGTIAENTPPPE